MDSNKIYLDKLLFYWRVKNRFSDKNIVPDFLPFEFEYNTQLKLIMQKRDNMTLRCLGKAYKELPNIGNIQDGNQWSGLYGKDFLKFIYSSLSKIGKKKAKILEIGCGGCLLLQNLKKKGYEVLGIDPSPLARREGKKRAVKVIRDSFPSRKLKGEFDVIFHSDVIEHVVDPVVFLKKQFDHLGNNGILIISTPDCTESIEVGDISMILHQHLNYFDTESLQRAVGLAGFDNIYIQKAGYGGSLYCFAKKSSKRKKSLNNDINSNDVKFRNFLKKHLQIKYSIKSYVDRVMSDKNSSFGFYAPVRAFPYISIMNMNSGFRFFDDTAYWHMKYFDGMDIPIENFEDLTKKSVENLIIMSPTFGEVIKQKVTAVFGKKIKVKNLTDFY